MHFTASAPFSASESPNPFGFPPAAKRPVGVFTGIGFILPLWVQRMFREHRLPTSRSLTLIMALSDIVDVDGRWCFYHLDNLAERCGRLLSVRSLKRAIEDLVRVGLVRKLDRPQTLDFFAADIARGRSIHRLPCVLELLVPADAYPGPVLAEINACRAGVGEEPITPHNRPAPRYRRPRVQIDLAPSSNRATDSFPGDSSGNGVGGSVRGSASTGEEKQQRQPNGPHGIIDRIHDRFLSDPQADRQQLAMAVDDLLDQDLSVEEVRALFSGLDRLKRPFPALMFRMRSLKTARAFLVGALGGGIDARGPSSPSWSVMEDVDPFAEPERFLLDSQGKATHTCPEHWRTRNEPGGTCAICGRWCRSVPGEIMHDPVPESTAPPEGPPAPGEQGAELPAALEEGLDLRLRSLIAASLEEAGGAALSPPPPTALDTGPWKTLGSGISPRSRGVIEALRGALGDKDGAGLIPPPRTATHDLVDDAPPDDGTRSSGFAAR